MECSTNRLLSLSEVHIKITDSSLRAHYGAEVDKPCSARVFIWIKIDIFLSMFVHHSSILAFIDSGIDDILKLWCLIRGILSYHERTTEVVVISVN
jgi:hypothetical protein